MKDGVFYVLSITAVNLDWIDPLSKAVVALVALGGLVLKIMEFRRDSKEK